jgi:hypothetical protein
LRRGIERMPASDPQREFFAHEAARCDAILAGIDGLDRWLGGGELATRSELRAAAARGEVLGWYGLAARFEGEAGVLPNAGNEEH